MIFWDEKRPITIDILGRLSLEAVAMELGLLEKYLQWADGSLPPILVTRVISP
jgi:hypothetical protein